MTKEYVNLYDAHGRSLGATNKWQRVPDAFDYIIFKDGDKIKAKDGKSGRVEFKDISIDNILSSVISSANDFDKIYIKGNYTVNKTFTLDKPLKIIWDGKITLNGNDLFVIDCADPDQPGEIFLDYVKGTNAEKVIKIVAAKRWIFKMNVVENTYAVVTFEPVAQDSPTWYEGNTIILGTVLNNSGAYGVYIAPEPTNVYVEGTLIFCAAAIHAPVPLKFDGGAHQLMIGGVHTSGTYDIDDANARDGSVYVLLFSTHSHNLHGDSVVIDKSESYFSRRVLIQSSDKLRGLDLRGYDGNIEIWRDDETPFIDFKNTNTEDYRVRIIKTTDDGLQINVDGLGANISAFTIEGSGRNKPYIFKFPTSAPDSPQAGDAYFDPGTGTLYIYNGSTWRKVQLT